jgi:hypothetical protein
VFSVFTWDIIIHNVKLYLTVGFSFCYLQFRLALFLFQGSGKTALTRASAKYFEDHKDILAHM